MRFYFLLYLAKTPLTGTESPMHFILSHEFIDALFSLRKAYEKASGFKLTAKAKHAPLGVFFGKKDLSTRHEQISFIEKWLTVFQPHLEEKQEWSESNKPIEQTNFSEAIESQLMMLRILFIACLYIRQKINATYLVRSENNSILEKLLNQAIGLSAENCIDEETRACCLLSTLQFLDTHTNSALHFTGREWNNFYYFVSEEKKKLNEKHITNYPITNLMLPIFVKPFELLGYSTGFILGDILGKSTQLLHTKYALTAAISSGLLFILGPTKKVGLMLLVPTYAGSILDTFSGLTLAWLFGSLGNVTGKGLGVGIGMPLDLSYKLIQKILASGRKFGEDKNNQTKPSGICLVDGSCCINGIKLHSIASLDEQIKISHTPQDLIEWNDKGSKSCARDFLLARKYVIGECSSKSENFSI